MKKLLLTTIAGVMLFASNAYAGCGKTTVDNTAANNYTDSQVSLLRKAGDVASRVLNGTISPDNAAAEMSKMVAAGDLAQADADYIQGQIVAFRRDYEAKGNKLQQLADLVNGAPTKQDLEDIVDSIEGDGGLIDQIGALSDRVTKNEGDIADLKDKTGSWTPSLHNGNTMAGQINENEKAIGKLQGTVDGIGNDIASGDADTLAKAKDYTDDAVAGIGADITSGDADTLAKAKDYTDDKVKDMAGNVTEQVKDDLSGDIASGDAATLAAANKHADDGDAATLAAANKHADDGDAATLAAANRYTDDAISGVDGKIASGDAATLGAAKDYADTQDAKVLSSAKNYADTQDAKVLSSAKNYADTQDAKVFAAANENAKGYAAQAQQNAMNYADAQDAKVLETAQSYTDAQDQKVFAAANENAKGYAAQAQSNAENYADAKDAELEQRVTASYQKADAEMEARITEAYTAADEAVKQGVFIAEGIDKLNTKVNGLTKQMKSSFAASAAMAALVPNARAEGNTHLAAGTGYYDGKMGAAIGVFHYIDDNVLLNAGLAYAGNDSFTAKGGVTVGF